MVNITDYFVGFRLRSSDTSIGDTNAVYYQANPEIGILAPRSAQRVVVARIIKGNEPEDTLYNERVFMCMWNDIVSEGIKVSDLDLCFTKKQTNEFPIILNKVSSIPNYTMH
jgi:hypothetical protein